jgi:hypothetical protein
VPTSTYDFGHLDAYDQGNGSVNLAWGPVAGVQPASYNVYVNGVLYSNVTTRQATVSGLIQTSYSSSAVAPTPANGPRPQNMPPNGVVTPASTYVFVVTALVAGVEVARSEAASVTPAPVSIMLTTPMKRLWPFPNTGLD